MSTSLSFIGSVFAIHNIEQLTSKSIRVTFTQDPLAVNSSRTQRFT